MTSSLAVDALPIHFPRGSLIIVPLRSGPGARVLLLFSLPQHSCDLQAMNTNSLANSATPAIVEVDPPLPTLVASDYGDDAEPLTPELPMVGQDDERPDAYCLTPPSLSPRCHVRLSPTLASLDVPLSGGTLVCFTSTKKQ